MHYLLYPSRAKVGRDIVSFCLLFSHEPGAPEHFARCNRAALKPEKAVKKPVNSSGKKK